MDEMVWSVDQVPQPKKQLVNAKTDEDKTYYEKKCRALGRQINCFVYELYGLAEEEIEVVEGCHMNCTVSRK